MLKRLWIVTSLLWVAFWLYIGHSPDPETERAFMLMAAAYPVGGLLLYYAVRFIATGRFTH